MYKSAGCPRHAAPGWLNACLCCMYVMYVCYEDFMRRMVGLPQGCTYTSRSRGCPGEAARDRLLALSI